MDHCGIICVHCARLVCLLEFLSAGEELGQTGLTADVVRRMDVIQLVVQQDFAEGRSYQVNVAATWYIK